MLLTSRFYVVDKPALNGLNLLKTISGQTYGANINSRNATGRLF
jgi:hypothetical protein